jgi:peptide/nickel transport system ATP-binding protein
MTANPAPATELAAAATPAAAGAAGGDPVAAVTDLRVTFRRGGRDIHALRGVSLDVRPGEILGLVGESGSGKSVLGMSLLGLLPDEPRPQTSGQVRVCGEDMLTGSAALRRRVRRQHLGAVFQDPMTSLNPTMRVGRQVAEAAGSDAEAARLLRAAGISDPQRRMASYPHELSGGLRQRVMIAMALAGSPSLVVADEPTTALDVMVQAQVLALLRSLCDETGCSFLMITHDLGVAAQVADRVAVMYAGRVAEVGPAPVVLRAAAHPYSRALTRARLSLTADRSRPLVTLPGEVPDPASPPPGCPFQPRCQVATDGCGEQPPDPVPVAAGHLSACILPPPEVSAAEARAGAGTGGGTLAADLPAAGASAGDPPAGQGPAAAVPAQDVPAQDVPAEEVLAAPAPPLAVWAQGTGKGFRVRARSRRPGSGRLYLRALQGVTLTVAEGESVAIVGESGSGKSTLLRVIAGLERPDEGDIVLGPGARPQMVFQDAGASLTPWLTVGSLIGERLRDQRLTTAGRRQRVVDALAHVGLPAEVATARAGQLSGGQRQRVALARATAVPPEVLLCDEPTSALDVSLAAGVLNLIGRLRRELGMAVVFVTHDLSVARVVADRIAVMYLGRIVELGNAEDVVARPRHPYTKALIGAVPDLGVTPAAAPGDPASPLAPPPGCAFHPRCPIAEPSCADPDLTPRLTRLPGEEHLVACVRWEVT